MESIRNYPARREKTLGRCIIAALTALPILLFLPQVFGRSVFFHHDLQFYFYPYHKIAVDILRSGHLPLWNPYSFGGMPLIGDGQTALFYPLNWLYFLMEASHAMSLGIVLNFCVAAVGMFCFSRITLRLGWAGTCMATLAFTFNGFLVARIGHPSLMAGASLIPFLFAAADRAIHRSWSARRTIALGAVVALQALCGHPQIPVYAAMALAIYLAICSLRFARGARIKLLRRAAFQLLASYLIGAALAAVQILPWLELIKLSSRQATASYEFLSADSITGIGWLLMLFPYALGGMKESFLQHGTHWDIPVYAGERLGYVGIVPLVLAIFAIVTMFPFRRSNALSVTEGIELGETHARDRRLPLAMVLVAMLLIAAGNGTPFGRVVYIVPLVGKLRCYARAIGVAAFALAALAGIGMDRLINSRNNRFIALIVAGTICVVAIFVALIASHIQFAADWSSLDRVNDAFHASLSLQNPARPNAWIPILLALAALSVLSLQAFVPRAKRIAVIALIGITAFDLCSFAATFAPTMSPEEFTAPSAAAQFLKQTMADSTGNLPPFRIINFNNDNRLDPVTAREQLAISWAMPFGLEDVNGFNSLQPRRQIDFLFSPETNDVSYGAFPDLHGEKTHPTSNQLNELDVRFVLVPRTYPATIDPSWRNVFSNSFVDVYGNPSPRGRASFPKQLLSEGVSEQNVLALSRINNFPSDRIAFVDGLPPSVAAALSFAGEGDPRLAVQANGNVDYIPPTANAPLDDPPAAIRIDRRTPNEFDFEIDVTRPRFVTLGEPFFPGWEAVKAAPDGTRDAVSIYRTNYLFRGVIADSSATKFEMFYRPHWLYGGIVVSVLAFIGCGLSLVAERKSSRGLQLRAMLLRALDVFKATPDVVQLSVHDGGVRTACLTLTAVCLGIAIQLRDGLYTPSGIGLLFASIVFAIIAITLPRRLRWPRSWPSADRLVFAAAIPLYFALMASMIPAVALETTGYESFRLFPILITLAAFVAAGALMEKPPLGRLTFPILLLIFTTIGIWVIRRTPDPTIDVFLFQRDAAEALLHGRNPYAMTFRNMYGEHTWVYATEVMKDGRLLFGYPYMPLTLLLTTAAHFVFGDYRYMLLIAAIVTAIAIAYAKPSRVSVLAATLWLFTPRAFFMIAQGWTEPIVVMCIAIVVFTAIRWRRAMPYALGLLLVSKQYLPAAVLLTPLLTTDRARWRAARGILLRALTVATAVSLPLIAWNFGAFWNSAVALQFKQPFRFDALSLLVWFENPKFSNNAPPTGTPPPFATVISFAAIGIGIALSLWRSRRSASGFAAAVALSFLLFFAFNKQAFANYYLFVIGALWCAVATSQGDESVL